MTAPKKALGQHWLHDRQVLVRIAEQASITREDTVLEIGPGLGTLTSVLLAKSKNVVAVEFDESLAAKLPGQFPGKDLTVIHHDILSFDLSQLPVGYKVVANVPYYITSKIVQYLLTGARKPSVAVLLVQKEVAQRLAAMPGNMSVLAISAQVYAIVTLGEVVPARLFTPPPKVDSQVVVLTVRPTPLFTKDFEKMFFRVVKAGFSAKRKKLRSSLAGGLGKDKSEVEQWLAQAEVNPDIRAEDVTLAEWMTLASLLS